MSNAYKEAGVDIHAGYESVALIKKHVNNTNRLGVLNNIGSFGSLFDLGSFNYQEPVLVSGTDGVGTKLLVAINQDKHDTIGQDVVAMCVNDIVAQGARPLFFLDYLAVGKNEPTKIEQLVKGVSDGCVLANCALVGGETAEMPDMYEANHYDIAGFSVGVVEKSKIITGEKTKVGDVIIGLKASGVHSNGYSLVRKLINDNKLDYNTFIPSLNTTLGEALLTPTRIYVNSVLAVLNEIDVHGIAHITGGGFDENIERTLNKGLYAKIDVESYPSLPIFDYLHSISNISKREMYNVFNMGIGMILVVAKADVAKTLEILEALEEAYVIGEVVEGETLLINV